MAAQRDTVIHECRCEECKRSPVGERAKLHGSINRVMESLDERGRRHFVGLLASQHGWRNPTTRARDGDESDDHFTGAARAGGEEVGRQWSHPGSWSRGEVE